MFQSLITSLPFGNRQVGVCQWDFPVGNRNFSIADSNVSVRNLDVAFKTVGFCGRATECSGHRLQVSGWRRQISRLRPQFRVAGQGKLLSITGILLFVTGMLLSAMAIFRSGIGRSRLATGLRRSGLQKQMPHLKFATALEIDAPMYSKIERRERPTKRKQIAVIAQLLKTEENMLVILWIADKILAAIGDEKEFVGEALEVVQ